MSKKDFILLADYIRRFNNVGEVEGKFTPAQINYLASFCKEVNSNFKTDRWLDYIAGKCGPNGGAQ